MGQDGDGFEYAVVDVARFDFAGCPWDDGVDVDVVVVVVVDVAIYDSRPPVCPTWSPCDCRVVAISATQVAQRV